MKQKRKAESKEIKIKVKDIVENLELLKVFLYSPELSLKAKFSLSEIASEIYDEFNYYTKEEKKIIDEYSDVNNEEEVIIPEESKEEFKKRIIEIQSKEITLKFNKIVMSDFMSNNRFGALHISKLRKLGFVK